MESYSNYSDHHFKFQAGLQTKLEHLTEVLTSKQLLQSQIVYKENSLVLKNLNLSLIEHMRSVRLAIRGKSMKLS